MRKFLFFVYISLFLFSTTGCTLSSKSTDYGYLTNEYNLQYVGDIHGRDMEEEEVLNRYKGYTDYLYLFDKSKCYMNFQCKGSSYGDFWCEGSIVIVQANGDILFENKSFSCWAEIGLYYGVLKYNSESVKEQIVNIYIYAPYWCRLQLYYDIEGNGEKVLLTFEFWKGKYNELPDFLDMNSHE